MNDFRILIRNTDTDEKKWYICPLNEEQIANELNIPITDESGIDYDHYIIDEIETPYSVPRCQILDDVSNEYDIYCQLPQFLQDNIGPVMEEFDCIQDVLEIYKNDGIDFCPDYKSKYDYIRYVVEVSRSVPTDMLDYIDYDKYLTDFEFNNSIVESKDGIIVIRF